VAAARRGGTCGGAVTGGGMAEAQLTRSASARPGIAAAEAAALGRVLALVGDRMQAVEREFDSYLRSDIPLIAEIGRYLVQSGGKRIRPALLLLSARLGDACGDRDVLFASVFELIHTATLVHDDVIDQAATRRGQRSVNGRWGNQVTVLLGDYLYIKSMNTALTAEDLRVIQVLGDITQKMIEGELIQAGRNGAIDVAEEDYLEVVRRKTAFLFSGCCRVGGMVGGLPAEQQEALAAFGLNLGMAFQITDDILDLTASESSLGKPVASDLREGKLTLPLIYLLRGCSPADREKVAAILADGDFGRVRPDEILRMLRQHGSLSQARTLAEEYAAQAIERLLPFPPSPARQCLLDIPPFIVGRER